MGGVKKRSMASMERQQQSQGEEETKKEKSDKTAFQQQKRLTFLPPKMTDEEILKSISPLKAITVYSASRALGVNSSVASSLLLSLEGKSLLKRAGGFSGHYVWALALRAS